MSDITEIFARDPLTLTKEDLAFTCQYYRDKRKQHIRTDTPSKKAPAKPKKPSILDQLGDLKL